jgi:tetratricopeptide (TPR) repeat protein
LAALLLVAGCGDGEEGDPVREEGTIVDATFPTPAEPRPVSRISPDEFAGADACAECHAEQYGPWAASTHGRAGGEPSPDLVIAPFDGSPIQFADGVVIPRVADDGAYQFVVQQNGFDAEVMSVDGVVGGGHMLGGGTQGFFTRHVDGTVRFLPFDWSRSAGEWFCNTGTRTDAGWVPVTPSMRLADCGDWPPIRVLGTEDRFSNCQGCHGSQIRVRFEEEAQGWSTSWTSLSVNCESCHGPAADHVRRAEAGDFGSEGLDLGIASLAVQDKDASLQVCFQCHALKDVLTDGYLPGDSLDLFYAQKYPTLGDEPFFPDARVRSFAYQGTHLSSACYLDGAMDCVSCHEPHGQGYWDQHRNPLPDPFDDGQCTACHAAKAEPLEAHTFHPPDSEGSRCVNCHMPYLQEPSVGPGVPYARSDHTIPNPRPAFDDAQGIESSCARCHQDRSPRELQVQTEAWWGELKPHRPLVTGQLEALEAAASGAPLSRAAAAEALLRPDQNDPLLQFQALGMFVVQHLGPDEPTLEPEVEARLLALSESEDLDVRSFALAALHWSRGTVVSVRGRLAEALRNEPGWALRSRWALGLGFLADREAEAGNVDRAQIGYRRALEVSPDDPRILSAQGLSLYRVQRFSEAIPLLQRAVALDPEASLTRVNLGIAQAAAGDVAGAQQTYVGLLETNPSEPLGWFNLGNLLQRTERVAEATEAYARALNLDPSLAPAWFQRARTLILLNRIPDALEPARRALELDPTNDLAQQMVSDLERALGAG